MQHEVPPLPRLATQGVCLAGQAVDTGAPVLRGPSLEPLWAGLQARPASEKLVMAGDDAFLVGAVSLPITAGVEAPTAEIYDRIFAATDPYHLCRIWHFVPRINQLDTNGRETYRSFCVARAEAFASEHHSGIPRRLPAASAVGTDSTNLTVIFAAHRTVPMHFENPLQVSAYRYPPQYGPRSPSFSRATVVPLDSHRGHLFLSGTAAIRGHETVAPGRTLDQLGCTLENLDVVARTSGLCVPLASRELGPKHIRVYVRHASDLEGLARALEGRLVSPDDVVSYIRSDICRDDLTVEIEVTLLDAPIRPTSN